MPIYAQTELGRAALRDKKSDIPRKMRTLLIAVDGRTSLEVYEKNLSAFGDVKFIFDSLINSGLIVDTLAPADKPSAKSNDIKQASASVTPSSNRDINPLNSLENFEFERAVDISPENKLRQSIALMCNFVIAYLPNESLEMMLAFEQLKSISDLKENLKSYAAIIKSIGSQADIHLDELKKILSHD